MNRVAVIVAGGTGSRMGRDIPKQFLTVNGRAIILYTIEAFITAFADIRIILVLHKDYIEYAKQLIDESAIKQPIDFVEGGDTRFQSVKNGLHLVEVDSIVFVHDAVRCLVSPDLIIRCADHAVQNGSAIPVIPVRDSIRKLDKSTGNSFAVPRDDLFIVQTPQTFRSDIILSAFEAEYHHGFTDEATVVEAHGSVVHMVEGEERNIKITYPEELSLASWRLGQQ
jgi:2-C-methyl-D-erythritol 4-phosphate cytidylyltransferase